MNGPLRQAGGRIRTVDPLFTRRPGGGHAAVFGHSQAVQVMLGRLGSRPSGNDSGKEERAASCSPNIQRPDGRRNHRGQPRAPSRVAPGRATSDSSNRSSGTVSGLLGTPRLTSREPYPSTWWRSRRQQDRHPRPTRRSWRPRAPSTRPPLQKDAEREAAANHEQHPPTPTKPAHDRNENGRGEPIPMNPQWETAHERILAKSTSGL